MPLIKFVDMFSGIGGFREGLTRAGAVSYTHLLDVGSSHPGAEFGPKGLAVRQLKRYASWVQTVSYTHLTLAARFRIITPSWI